MSTPKRTFQGTGWRFPIRVGSHGGLSWSSGESKIEQSIWLILSTAPKERVMRPRFGCGIHNLVFAPNSPATHAAIGHQAREALVRWEPRIDVLDVRVSSGDEENLVLIRVDYRVRSTNRAGNLVYPFHLQSSPEP